MTLPDKLARWRSLECECEEAYDTSIDKCRIYRCARCTLGDELIEELAEMRVNLIKATAVFDDPYDPSFFRAAQRIINGEIPK